MRPKRQYKKIKTYSNENAVALRDPVGVGQEDEVYNATRIIPDPMARIEQIEAYEHQKYEFVNSLIGSSKRLRIDITTPSGGASKYYYFLINSEFTILYWYANDTNVESSSTYSQFLWDLPITAINIETAGYGTTSDDVLSYIEENYPKRIQFYNPVTEAFESLFTPNSFSMRWLYVQYFENKFAVPKRVFLPPTDVLPDSPVGFNTNAVGYHALTINQQFVYVYYRCYFSNYTNIVTDAYDDLRGRIIVCGINFGKIEQTTMNLSGVTPSLAENIINYLGVMSTHMSIIFSTHDKVEYSEIRDQPKPLTHFDFGTAFMRISNGLEEQGAVRPIVIKEPELTSNDIEFLKGIKEFHWLFDMYQKDPKSSIICYKMQNRILDDDSIEIHPDGTPPGVNDEDVTNFIDILKTIFGGRK